MKFCEKLKKNKLKRVITGLELELARLVGKDDYTLTLGDEEKLFYEIESDKRLGGYINVYYRLLGSDKNSIIVGRKNGGRLHFPHDYSIEELNRIKVVFEYAISGWNKLEAEDYARTKQVAIDSLNTDLVVDKYR